MRCGWAAGIERGEYVDSLYFLIPIALIFVAIAVRVLFWAINSGQYDNLDTEAHRILFDEQVQADTRSARSSGTPPDSSPEERNSPKGGSDV